MRYFPSLLKISLIAIFVVIINPGFVAPDQPDSYEKLWKEAQNAAEKGLPKTAFDLLETMRTKAISEGNGIQLIRANLLQYSLMQSYEEDYLIKAIAHAEAQLALLKRPEKELMHSLIAEMYWFYFQQNRFEILSRGEIKSQPSSDLRELDLRSLRNTIADHYSKSLEALGAMDSIPLSRYELLLTETQKEGLQLQPSLFDFVAARALDYYQNKDASLSENFLQNSINNPDYWLPVVNFTALNLPQTDHQQIIFLDLLQKVLLSNIKQNHTDALIYNELKRFSFLKDTYSGPGLTDSLYQNALEDLQKTFANHPAMTEVAAARAAFLLEGTDTKSPDYAAALNICEEAIKRFPDSRGSKQCQMMKTQMLTKELSAEVQRVELPNQVIAARLSYRNITKPSFRILKINSEKLSALMQNSNQEEQAAAFSIIPALHSWSIALPFEADYNTHSTIIDLPALEKGLYVLLVSDTNDFTEKSILSFTSFQVSELAFISRKRDEKNEFYLLHRQSGKAISKANLRIMGREYDYRSQKYAEKEFLQLASAHDGSFSFGPEDIGTSNQAFFVEAMFKGDTLYSDNYFDVYKRRTDEREQTKTWFFTDRAIYRPGQVVYFKGIILKKKGRQDWDLSDKQTTKVQLFDVNSRPLTAITLTTNAYGSFEGSFNIPQNLMNGSMRISNESGNSNILVEEYKRPTFEVKLEADNKQHRLNEAVTIHGTAMALAGYAADSMAYTYTVERETVFPYRSFWRGFPPRAEKKLMVAQGSAFTKNDGTFTINFDALTSPLDNDRFYPVFAYTVSVDVTDRNGETRRGTTTLNLSNRALILETNLDGVVGSNATDKFLLKALNLQQKSVEATVKVEFFQLPDNNRITRPLRWEPTDRNYHSNEHLKVLFPYDDFSTPSPALEKENKLIWKDEKFVNGSSSLFPKNVTNWPEGNYLLQLTATDAFGKEVVTEQSFSFFKEKSKKIPSTALAWFHLDKTTAEPGDTLHFYVGSSEKNNHVRIEISSGEQLLKQQWIKLNKSRKTISFIVEESHRGALRFEAVFVRHNSVLHQSFDVNVPFSNKKLDITLETKRDKLLPGSQETWTIRVNNNDQQGETAEVLAAMYDASLDLFQPHSWDFNLIQTRRTYYPWSFDNGFLTTKTMRLFYNNPIYFEIQPLVFPAINWHGLGNQNFYRSYNGTMPMLQKSAQTEHDGHVEMSEVLEVIDNQNAGNAEKSADAAPSYLRSDFRETAFFYPQLNTDSNGLLSFSFKLPDALTRWKLMLLTHSKELQSGLNTYEFAASKDLMVVPNLPRFYRQGDTAWIATKVVNTGTKVLNGIVRLSLSDALTAKKIEPNLANKPFINLQPGQSQVLKWEIVVGDQLSMLAVNISATAETFTDSEQQLLPVLPSGTIVTESMPLHIAGNTNKIFVFKGLKANRPLEKNHRLHLEMSSNPVWYAIQALPYLENTGNESVDNIFYRYYSNRLATHLAKTIPGLMTTIESWKKDGGTALQSPLENNVSLKAVSLLETPWVADAMNENRQKNQLVLLFDVNRMAYEQQQAVDKLLQRQLPDGGWAWFPGMPGSRYITQNIVSGFGKLNSIAPNRNLPNALTASMNRAIQFLDQELVKDYKKMLDRKELPNYQLHSMHLNYLYTRSFYPQIELKKDAFEAMRFLLDHTASDWQKLSLYMKAKAAVVLFRNEKQALALDVLASIKEFAQQNEELGIYWMSNRNTYSSTSSIETHTAIMEAFDEIAPDVKWMDGMRKWLLTQKQTNKWESGRATAEAVYVLLMKGSDWLTDPQPVEITIGNQRLESLTFEAGTGLQKKDWFETQIDSSLATIEVNNPNKIMAWGSVFRQYSVPMDQIKASTTQLSVRRELYLEKAGPQGIQLIPLPNAQLQVGDRIRVRLVLEADRDMEFIHLKDFRAAAFEPVTTLSGYHFDFGLGTYQTTRDASTDFFFDLVPKGKYILEYSLTAMQSGYFTHGYALIQSFYAPEFSSHSDGIRIEIK